MTESWVAGLRVVEVGPREGPPVLFRHGWPQSWRAWAEVMRMAAADGFRALAVDLPGVGGSARAARGGEKHVVAAQIHEVVESLGLGAPVPADLVGAGAEPNAAAGPGAVGAGSAGAGLVMVGMGAGGMVAHAYAREYPLRKVVIADTVIPGLDPWEEVLANPYVWHFAFHSIAGLPEAVVTGREREWFDYFYDAISADPTKITDEARVAYIEAYCEPGALTVGIRVVPRDEGGRGAEPGARRRRDAAALPARGERAWGHRAVPAGVRGRRVGLGSRPGGSRARGTSPRRRRHRTCGASSVPSPEGEAVRP